MIGNTDTLRQMAELQQAPIKNIAFSGGGAKGGVYSGVHAALSDSNLLAGVEQVAGSSAGSIAAAAIASGISKERYEEIGRTTNIKGLLGNEGFLLLNKDATPLRELLATTVCEGIATYLDKVNIHDVIQHRIQTVQDKQQIAELTAPGIAERLLTIQEKSVARGDITFGELDLLHLIAPETFKSLTITAVARDTGELTLFNAQNSPDVAIADACRASCSIPGVFKPHVIDGKEYVDGGYRNNVPIRHFKGNTIQPDMDEVEDITNNPDAVKQSIKEGRTMCFVFDNLLGNVGGFLSVYSAKKTMVDFTFIGNFIINVIAKMLVGVGGNFRYTEEENKTYGEVRENAVNAVVLNTGKVDVLSFDQAQRRADYLHVKGYLQTMNFVSQQELAPTPNLEEKNFILGVYEEMESASVYKSMTRKVVKGHEQKLNDIVGLCKEESWNGRSNKEVLRDLIVTAATKRTNSTLSTSTNSMAAVINQLNSPQASTYVKAEFIALLDLPGSRLTDNTIEQFKFEKSDFEQFLKAQQEKLKEQGHVETLQQTERSEIERT